MTHAETLDRALRLLARSRRLFDDLAEEIRNDEQPALRIYAGVATDLANAITALIGHSVTDQPEAPEMFALREHLDEIAERDSDARPRKVITLHMVYPDGTHTGDCEGCLWSQSQ